jgi:hypothetical protein
MGARAAAIHLRAMIDWLLDSDPAVRWQALRDVLDAPEAQWRTERAKVATEGWGAQLLALEDEDGQWAGGSFVPAGFTPADWEREGQPWTATHYALTQLREFGLDPARMREAVKLIGEHSRWDHEGQPFWEGEVDDCINGRTIADGAYFGVDVSGIVARELAARLPDGGWNCYTEYGAQVSSFASTLNVLEGLLEYERATGGTPATRAARASGEAYLLERRLFRRLSTGEPADPRFLEFLYPSRWNYDVLRALDYFRSADAWDPRLEEAIEHVRARRRDDGTWALDWSPPGRVWFALDDGPGKPSRWVTLRALRVIKWAERRSISTSAPTPGASAGSVSSTGRPPM